jgi:hypothetical protein
MAHDDDSVGHREDLGQGAQLRRARGLEDGMQRRDDRDAEVRERLEEELPRLAAEDAVLVLHGDHVDLVHVEEVGGAPVGGAIVLRDLEADDVRVAILLADVVHRQDEGVERRVRRHERLT